MACWMWSKDSTGSNLIAHEICRALFSVTEGKP